MGLFGMAMHDVKAIRAGQAIGARDIYRARRDASGSPSILPTMPHIGRLPRIPHLGRGLGGGDILFGGRAGDIVRRVRNPVRGPIGWGHPSGAMGSGGLFHAPLGMGGRGGILGLHSKMTSGMNGYKVSSVGMGGMRASGGSGAPSVTPLKAKPLFPKYKPLPPPMKPPPLTGSKQPKPMSQVPLPPLPNQPATRPIP